MSNKSSAWSDYWYVVYSPRRWIRGGTVSCQKGFKAFGPAGKRNRLRLDNLRSDIDDINGTGWRILIVDNAVVEDHAIESIDSNVIETFGQIHANRETGIRYVIFRLL